MPGINKFAAGSRQTPTDFYASKLKAFAKKDMVSAMGPNEQLLSFDGEVYPDLPKSFLTHVSFAKQMGDTSTHPIIELIDGLVSYVLINPIPSLRHSAQEDCRDLYGTIYELTGEYHQRVRELAMLSEAEFKQKETDFRTRLINRIRAAVWKRVKNRSSGNFHDVAWQFLLRTASRERSKFEVVNLEEIKISESIVDARLHKTLAAIEQVRNHNPNLLQWVFDWLSSMFASLFTRSSSFSIDTSAARSSPAIEIEDENEATSNVGRSVGAIPSKQEALSALANLQRSTRASSPAGFFRTPRRSSGGASPVAIAPAESTSVVPGCQPQ